jgi:hypothetical protein
LRPTPPNSSERAQLGQQVEVLKDESDSPVADVGELVAVETRDRLAAEAVLPVGGCVEAAEEVEQSRLAGP